MPKNLLNKKPLLFGVLAASLATGGAFYYNIKHTETFKPKNLNIVLNEYGFTSAAQKVALRYLMQESGIKNTEQLFADKANSIELAHGILELVNSTQDKFTIRTGKQERWEIDTPDWIQDKTKQPLILISLKILKMFEGVLPSFEQRDAICVLGATNTTMVERLKYAGELHGIGALPAKRLVFLVGERSAIENQDGKPLDGTKEELLALSRKIGKSGKDNNDYSSVTETDLMRESYEKSMLFNKLATHFIDTPRRDLPRPTTQTTVEELCIWLRQHPEIKTLTFVSNQPHVEYQKAIIAQVFEAEAMDIKFEVIGAECEFTTTNNNLADLLQYVVGALGSTIYAKTPGVLDALGFDLSSDQQLKQQILKIYARQPLILRNLDKKYQPK
jgi:hypothetical protein